MAGSGAGAGSGAEARRAVSGPVASALLAFEQVAVAAEAGRVREAGARVAERAGELIAALEEASAAASGVQAGVSGGLLSGPALAECAELLARRARAVATDTEGIAGEMERASGLLAEADEEGARRVAGAGG
ncbi:hypothetical protein [Rhodococcus sp. IEGM 1408]|uniref:hypothetical protein n=1 Tax=Rhodococcus sp. IEGM 1408 TaxID=3082220 RepID=UPI002955DDA8|nr:hypothetical protein [Rhodococcus sp. IEGM 1408]MDV8001652.1 hypothetical protein [Rhodococcus sp. IEGM 1408]